MNTQNSRSTELLNKVYDHLDTVDVSKLSFSEMSDFLEVVQKGRFLETAGQMPFLGFGGFGNAAPRSDKTTTDANVETIPAPDAK